jgi:hypothetical protein
VAHSSKEYMKNYMNKYRFGKRLKAKFVKAKAFLQWYEKQDFNNTIMLEMLERTIKIARLVPNFRQTYNIRSPLEAKEKLDLCGWQRLIIHKDFVINTEPEPMRYKILDDACKKVVALEMEVAANFKINPLYILEDFNIYLNPDNVSGKVYEEIVVSPEVFAEIGLAESSVMR